jgi:hypothetical protein
MKMYGSAAAFVSGGDSMIESGGEELKVNQ